MSSNSIPYRVIAMTMALLMFFTSFGFSVDMHYCQGQLKTVNFFGKAKSCYEVGKGMKNCPNHADKNENVKSEGPATNKKSCCNNNTVHFQNDQDQHNPIDNSVVVNSELQQFVFAFVSTFFSYSNTVSDQPVHADYRPPLIPRDIYVLLENFRL